jgi:hypothetical protein
MLAAPTPGVARSSVPAVRVDVISPAGRPRQILYIRAQADDAVLVKQPALTLYLKTLRPYRTLIKSASYLMHGGGFSRIRGELLAGSTSILQDDTGIPFSFLNTPEWDVRLYGEYTKPIKALGYSLQTDLAAAFAAPGRARPLPFTWGYHWRDGISHLMLAVRRQQPVAWAGLARPRGLQAAFAARPAISRSALSRPTRAHQPMFAGSASVVFAGVSPTEW